MDKKLEFVVGQADTGQPAVIRLFGPINRETAQQFNDEFFFLKDFEKNMRSKDMCKYFAFYMTAENTSNVENYEK